ncbi:MAG: peptidoglycan-associated lipoprotein Pal [Alphaproteobacteria bacterium]
MQKLIMVAFTLMFAVACHKAGNKTNSHSNVAHPDHLHHNANVVPGSQADLEANVGNTVYFAFDSSSLNAESQATLSRQAAWMKANPKVSVAVEGHCDLRGTREYNLGLGERRANAAKNFLVSAGIEASRITTISYGKERPAVLGDGEEVWSKNRRSATVVAQ